MFKKIISFILIIVFSYLIGFAYTNTPNLNLKLMASADDAYTVIECVNDNFDLVDDIFNTVSLIEFGYLDGVTSAIQTQFDNSTFVALTDTPANYTGSAGLFAKVNAGATALEFAAGGGGDTLPVVDTTGIAKGSTTATKIVRFEVDGLTADTTRVLTVPDKDLTLVGTVDKLSVFAATTSAELAGVISDEIGAGKLRFDTAVTIKKATATLTVAQTGTILVSSNIVTGTDIAFVDGGAGEDTITSVANAFGGYAVGDKITITGATNAGNNNTFTLTGAAVGTLTVATASLVAEAAGASVTIKNAYTLTLPTAVGNTGLTYHFIKTDANYFLITLDGDGTETFNYENSTGTPNLTYARLNTYCAEVTIVSDGANWQVIDEALGQVPECRAYLGTNQLNIVNATETKVLLDTENYDIGSNFNTANNRFVAPIPGKYLISVALSYTEVVADKRWDGRIWKNGTDLQIYIEHSALAYRLCCFVTGIFSLAINDYIEEYTYHEAGVDTPDITGSSDLTFMLIRLISKD